MADLTRSRRPEGTGRGAVVAAAVAATVAGHELAYRLAYLRGGERSEHLAATGHAYWPGAIRAAIVLALAGLVLQVARGRLATRSRPPAVVSLCSRLVPLQLGMFLAMEATERVAEHQSVFHLVGEPAFWLGLPAQLVIGVAVAFLLKIARRVGEALAVRLSTPHGERPSQAWDIPDIERLRTTAGASRRTRAPPHARAQTLLSAI